MALEVIAKAGHDAHRHGLVLVRCGCGGEFTARRDHVKSGRITRCPECKDVGEAPAPVTPASHAGVEPEPQPEPSPERNAEAIQADLAANGGALETLERQAAELSALLAKEGVLPAGLDGDSAAKLYREVVTTAGVARKERKRLERELRELSAQKAAPVSTVQSLAARLASVKRGVSR